MNKTNVTNKSKGKNTRSLDTLRIFKSVKEETTRSVKPSPLGVGHFRTNKLAELTLHETRD